MSTTQWLPIEFLEGEENRPPKESVGFPSSTEFWLKLIRVENSIYPAICEHDFLCRSSIERVHSLSLFVSRSSCCGNVASSVGGYFFCIFILLLFWMDIVVYMCIYFPLCFLIDWKWFFCTFFGKGEGLVDFGFEEMLYVGLDEMGFRI